ncbi:hypothetical protein G210_2423 [Candida maltosa Xu316]|uniref:Kinetochore protein n=1 Tax=Candida maltosa (strain Xu316) TaxID=1245528 RepID=M3J5E1_CANMX|nr:hypothetical protein G210_2423 [Candida maltosa Xu316]
MDNTSYRYTKNFIDTQISILNEPFEITPAIKELLLFQDDVTETDLQRIINKLNDDIVDTNTALFPSQVNNQVTQQIIKVENQKLKLVNQQLFRINAFIRPITLPDFETLSNKDKANKLKEVSELIRELPESKYLFLVNDPTDTIIEHDYHEPELTLSHIEMDGAVIQPTEAELASRREHRREYIQEINEAIVETDQQPNRELIEKYEDLRVELIEISDRLLYKDDKIEYLTNLKQNLTQLFNTAQSHRNNNDEVFDSDEEQQQEQDMQKG